MFDFSPQAELYAKYRPRYPSSLIGFILEQTDQKELAWDCATGNGQTAIALAPHFKQVMATDISQEQIDQATRLANIRYSVQPAEGTDLPNDQVDLITVSQALHWFQFDAFYNEVKRVSRAGAVLTAWAYSLFHTSPEIDKLIYQLYVDILGKYWDKERHYVDEKYRTIPFPFSEIATPVFEMKYNWTIQELGGYLNTWSAVQKFNIANKYNPVDEVLRQLQSRVKDQKLEIVFPLHVRMGRVKK
jgi:hypothetical protein